MVGCCIACLGFSHDAIAQFIKFNDIQNSIQAAAALHSSEDKVLGYGANSNRLETYRFQHEHDYNLGSTFFLYDRLHSNEPLGGPVFGPHNPSAFAYGPGNSTYSMVIGTELHASKVFGFEPKTGFLRDCGAFRGASNAGGITNSRRKRSVHKFTLTFQVSIVLELLRGIDGKAIPPVPPGRAVTMSGIKPIIEAVG